MITLGPTELLAIDVEVGGFVLTADGDGIPKLED
jgi:hypothetical protein